MGIFIILGGCCHFTTVVPPSKNWRSGKPHFTLYLHFGWIQSILFVELDLQVRRRRRRRRKEWEGRWGDSKKERERRDETKRGKMTKETNNKKGESESESETVTEIENKRYNKLTYDHRVFTEPGFREWIVWTSGTVQTALFCDFFYYYLNRYSIIQLYFLFENSLILFF